MQQLLTTLVKSHDLHAKWLNSLSFLENAGARKISASEDTYAVSYLQLKHAAEEHRHAYYLKKQLKKLPIPFPETYEWQTLIAPVSTQQYLKKLDVLCGRYLKTALGLQGTELRYAAYLLVTYAIELRADDLYPIYQEVLDANDSKIMVKSIIIEEQGHLEEMISQLDSYLKDWKLHACEIIKMEEMLFDDWIESIKREVGENE